VLLDIQKLTCFSVWHVFREDWVAAIRYVADRLAESEDVDMASADRTGQCGDGYDVTNIDDLSAKFSVQGTSSSKSSGKKKVVCIYMSSTRLNSESKCFLLLR
jgi:hypothetical protein